jgi:hypothetical protein
MNVNRFLRALFIRVKFYITAPVKLVFIGAALSLFAFTPRDTDPLVRIITILQKWTDTIPQEKVYLHMDKPYYAVGDTIWFKGYVTIGSRHQLSKLSGALYVDLINEKDSVVKDLKLPVTSGMVVGDFILGDDYKQGSYRIRAYTQWMRNAGEDYFFDHTFTVGDVANHNIISKADYQYKDINNRQVLTATLNYTNDEGNPINGKNINYEIYIDKKKVWTGSAKTDAQGSIPVRIANDAHLDLGGAYIHTIQAGRDKYPIIRDFPIKAALSQSDVQFFPESGNLINGIASRVAFKAVGVDGLGIPITGKIVDETDTEVAKLETLHAGMGSFSLKPVSGKSYTANISFADGTTKTIALPKAVNEGYIVSVYQPNKDSVLIRIKATPVRAQNVSLIVHTTGEVIFSSPIKITNATTSLWLEKRLFPTGIAQFTLFSSTGEPLNERIAFIRSNDQMQLSAKNIKASYSGKEHMRVDLEADDSKGKSTLGNFSVSVIDESKVPVDEANESTILSNLLLTADLKGYIEKPNYYFTNETDEVNKALDNLMLTQGYRRFRWKDLPNTVSTKPAFEAESLGINITGKVTTLTNKLLPDATVNLVSVRAKVAKAASTDANGRFKFDGIFLTDSIKFAVQARAGKNSDKVKLILDSIPKLLVSRNKNTGDMSTDIAQSLKSYIAAANKQDDINEKLGRLDQVHRLREVRIRARKAKAPIIATQYGLRIPEGHADQTIMIKADALCPSLAICLTNVLRSAIFKRFSPGEHEPEIPLYPYMGGRPVSVILDGRKLDPVGVSEIFTTNPIDMADIVKIDVVRTNLALMSMLSDKQNAGPVIMIYTRRGFIKKYYTPSLINITPKGFNKVREFYSPKYDKPGDAPKLPDLRTTVYWNPRLQTDSTGKTAFDFYNADGPGTYKVIIEGINTAGELGRQVFKYTVEL